MGQRLSENGRGLTPAETLRIDLARAVLGRADVIVIASLRWSFDPENDHLRKTLQKLTKATVVLSEDCNTYKTPENEAV